MAFEPLLTTFPSASSAVITGYRDHLGLMPAAVRRATVAALHSDDFVQYDWDAGLSRESFAVLAVSTSGNWVIAYRADDRATRDTWLRSNAQAWLGYL